MYQTTAWPAVSPTSARITIFRFGQRPKDSISGFFEPFPSSIILWKTGLSFSFSRIHSEISSRISEARKGMRQPQSPKAPSPIQFRVARITIRLRNRPTVAVVWIQLV